MERVGYYQVEGEIARGGMGTVYRAKDRALDRSVALKFLHGGDAGELQPEDLKRFKREARVTARLRHPNIVAILGAGAHEGKPFIVMDLIEGESLRDTIQREGPLEPRRAARIARKLADALYYAHRQGVLHRDVKPENVLITREGEPFLTDFGVGKAMGRDTSITVTGEITGTPIYMPPEQATAATDQIGPRSDVYALGGTLYEMLTGVPPVRGKKVMEILEQVLNRPPDPPSKLRPGLDPALEQVCLTCLEKDPEQRYPDARALARALRPLTGEEGPAVGAPDGRPRFWLGLVAGLVAGAVVWAVLGALLLRARLGRERAQVRQGAAWLQAAGDRQADGGALDAALTDYRHALELDPGLAACRVRLARALRLQGHLDEALAELDRALAQDPALAAAYVERARVHDARGERPAALKDVERLGELGSPEVETLRQELWPNKGQ